MRHECHTSLSILCDVGFGLCLYERWFPSVEMRFDLSEDQCCDLIKVGMVEMVGFRQVMWLIMLESAMDRVLGVDPPGQHVPPRVWYGTACLLIRYAIDYVSCLVEWG
jgi:hypothetical protein